MTAYSIAFDPSTSFLKVRADGFWDQETIARFAPELAAAMADLRAKHITFGVLVDASNFAVQAQEIAQGLTRIVDAGNQENRAPTAIIAGTALVKMQASRSMAAPHLRVFAGSEEALSWLAEQLGRA